MIALAIAAVIGFSSPSGAIKCEASAKLLVCSVRHAAYAKRLQSNCVDPSGEMGSGVDWHGFSLTPRGKGQVLCTGGTMFPGSPPRFPKLPYNVPWKSGPFSCVAKSLGVSCSNGSHGFFISRQTYHVF